MTLSAYHVDERRSAWTHVRELARLTGAELSCDRRRRRSTSAPVKTGARRPHAAPRRRARRLGRRPARRRRSGRARSCRSARRARRARRSGTSSCAEPEGSRRAAPVARRGGARATGTPRRRSTDALAARGRAARHRRRARSLVGDGAIRAGDLVELTGHARAARTRLARSRSRTVLDRDAASGTALARRGGRMSVHRPRAAARSCATSSPTSAPLELGVVTRSSPTSGGSGDTQRGGQRAPARQRARAAARAGRGRAARALGGAARGRPRGRGLRRRRPQRRRSCSASSTTTRPTRPKAEADEVVYKVPDDGGDVAPGRDRAAERQQGDACRTRSVTVTMGGTTLTVEADGAITLEAAGDLMLKAGGDVSIEAQGDRRDAQGGHVARRSRAQPRRSSRAPRRRSPA